VVEPPPALPIAETIPASPRPIAVEQAAARWTALALPLALGAVQVLAAAALVAIEFAQPPPQPGFRGIALSNAVASPGARAAVALYRSAFAWCPLIGDGHVLSPDAYIWGRRVGLAVMALVQLAALLATLRDRRPALLSWGIGPILGTAVLVAYPPVNTDVFYYASVGRLANTGHNPYLIAPNAFRRDPFDPYNDWRAITAPYGPVWTDLSRLITWLTGARPTATSLGFKIAIGLSALTLAYVTALLARHLTGDSRRGAGAFVLVAWSPVLLLESAGTAHLDAVMMLTALGGLLLVARGTDPSVRAGLTLIAASALFKPVTMPLLLAAALVRLAAPGRPLRSTARAWLLDVAAIVALCLVALAPYWGGVHLPRALLDQQRRLYVDEPLWVNPLWVWLTPHLGRPGRWIGGTADLRGPAGGLASALVLLALAGSLVWLIRRYDAIRTARATLPTDRSPLLHCQVRVWAVATAAFALLPVNAHVWYAIWPLAPIALVWAAADRAGAPDTRPRLPWWLLAFLVWIFWSYLVYHTWPSVAPEP
jgi:hypothetical protein